MTTNSSEFHSIGGVLVYDGAEIAALDPTPAETIAVAGIRLCAGETGILHGHPGAKKTWVAIAMLLDALARGYSVVAFVGEGAMKSFAKRVRLLAAALQIDLVAVKDRVHVVYGPFGAATEDAASAMRAFLRRVQCRFVLLDPYVAYLGGLSENDGSAIRPLLDLLRAIMVNELNGALLIVSHNSKPSAFGGDTLRGSTVLEAWTENRSAIALLKDGSSLLVNKKVKDGEDGATFRVTLDVNDSSAPLQIEPIEPASADPTLSRAAPSSRRATASRAQRQAAILQLLADGNERTTRQVRVALNMSNDTASAELTVLLENSLIVSRKVGRSAVFRMSTMRTEPPADPGRSMGRDTAATT